jgi:hypothetical protein
MQNIAKILAKDYGVTSIGDIGVRYETRPAYEAGSGESATIIPEEQLPIYYNKTNNQTISAYGRMFGSENKGDGYSEYNFQPIQQADGSTIAVPVQQYSKSGWGAFAQDLGPIIPVINLALMASGVPPLYVAAGNVAFQAGAGNIKDIGDVLRTAGPIMAADPGIVGGAAKLYSAYQAFDQGKVLSGLATIASAGGMEQTALGLRLIDAVKTGNVPGALMTLGQMQGVGDYQFKGADGKPLVGSDGKPVTLSTFKVGGENGFTLPELSKAATIATTLMSDNPNYGLALQLAGELKNSPDTVMAGRAASLMQQLSSPNPNPAALYNAALGLAQTTNARAPGSAPIENRAANTAVRVAAGDTGDAGANAILSASNAVGQNLTGTDGLTQLTAADLGTRSDATVTDNSVRSRLTPAQLQQLEENGFYVDENGDAFDENGNPKTVKIDVSGSDPEELKTRSLSSSPAANFVDDFTDNNDVLISDLGIGNTSNQLTPEQIRLLTTANNNDVLIADLGAGTTTPITGGTTTGGTTTPSAMPTVDQLDNMDAKRGATGDLIFTDKNGNSYYIDDDGDVQSLTREQANTLLTTVTTEDTGNKLDTVEIRAKYDPSLGYDWGEEMGPRLDTVVVRPKYDPSIGYDWQEMGPPITTKNTDTLTTKDTSTLTTKDTDTLTTKNITTIPTTTPTTIPPTTIPPTTIPPTTIPPTTAPPALTTVEARGLQALPTSEARYWRQTGATGTGGKGGVRFFDWYDTPENRTMALSTMATANIPAITSQQATAIATPMAKQYYNAKTNQYYTDPTGQWVPPAGWVQTNLKGGGKVENFSSGGTTSSRNTSTVSSKLARDFLRKAGVNPIGLTLKQLEAELARIDPTEVYTVVGTTKTPLGTEADIEANRQIMQRVLSGYEDYGNYKPDIKLRPDEVATVLRANGVDPYGLTASEMLQALHRVVGVGNTYSFDSINSEDLRSYFDIDDSGNIGNATFRETRKPYTGPGSNASSQTTTGGTTDGTTGGTTTAPPARTTVQARGLQTLPTSNARTIFATQSIPAITTTPVSTLATTQAPAVTTTPAPAATAPVAKQYFNQSTNRYYTDPTGTWQPPAGWVQTGLKGGGEVKTNFNDGGYADYDLGIDPNTYADYYLGIDPGVMNTDYSDIFDFDTGIDSTAAGNFDYTEDTLTPEQREQLNDARWASGYFGDPEDPRNPNYGNEGRAYSGRNAIDPITGSPINAKVGSPTRSFSGTSNALKSIADAAKKNPDLMKMLLAAGLGGLIGYAGRPKGITPLGMQGLGVSRDQVYGALKGKPIQRAEGGEIDGYAKGGGLHYLKSAEDGMADKIPATIDNKQPAKLSGGEFVIPADVVSHLGNGNSEAGAKQLYAMMDRIRHARTGTKKQGKQIKPTKFTPK